ncbi:DUF2524 family protein [Thalassobacillus sp. CUG 92003]|uniref:DUF2524 family protein n=1 Tax=Thalassobacillus sp. CUG 92003 TaxID=2736641 RepID=UPI0015E723E9|nr:DUF2524 family protein [Thalassobacillus sp. CUG 92003]
MTTRDSIDGLIHEATNRLDQANQAMNQADRNGYSINDEYVATQQALEQTEVEIQKMMNSANHQQKEQLHRLHLQVSQCLNDMILDAIDVDEHS